MVPNHRSYPSYKPSGIPRLGKVPVNWDVVQVGRIGRFFKGHGGTKEDQAPQGVPCIRYGDIYTSYKFHILKNRTFVTELKALDYTSIQYGDVLFAGSGETIEEIGKSAVNLLESKTCCGGDVILFRPAIEIDARFSGYAIDSPYAQYQKSCMGRGITVMHIYIDELKYLWIALPPLPEQAAIVRYLDHVDERIRRYMSSKERLIRLLEEEKQTVIDRVVTRGLDPSAQLRTPVIEWLGDIPAHWEVRRLRNAVDMRVSNVDKHINENELPIRLCNYVDVYKNDRITDSLPFMKATAAADEIDRFRLEQGDVLITKDSEVWNDIGVPALVEYTAPDLVCGYHLALLRPRPRMLNGAYLYRALQTTALAYQFYTAANGVTRYGLSHQAIKSVLLPLPPLSEQAAIACYLDRATADINAAINRARSQIALLQEYRTRLISDVVTGKLDVRGTEVGLPDEADALKPLRDVGELTGGHRL